MLPTLRQDLKLITGYTGLGGSPAWLLHDRPRNRFFRLGWLESELLRRWDRVHDMDQLIDCIHQETTLRISEAEIKKLIAFLTMNQLIQPHSTQPVGPKKTNPQFNPHSNPIYGLFKAEQQQKKSQWFRQLLHHYLFFSIPLLQPDQRLKAVLSRIPWILHPHFVTLAILSGLLGFYLVSRRWDLFLATFPQILSWSGMSIVAMAILFSKVIHEMGHALLAKHYGCHIPTMGVAFLVMWPVLYTDTSDTWRLTSRSQRLKVGAAGMVAELILAGFATLLWNFISDGALKNAMLILATTTWITTLVINANPLMRFDGYFLLSDWLDIANLQQRSFALGRWQLRHALLGINQGPPESLPSKQQRFLILFAWAVWIYRFFLFLGIALLVYHFFFKLLGLFLMLVEIYWFILRPILRELAIWIKSRSHISYGAGSTLALLFLIISGTLLIPWQGEIILPAVLRSKTFTNLYPPTAARLAQIHVKTGEHVNQGDRLFTLDSPELDEKMAINQLDRKRLLHESQQPGIHRSDREQRLVAVQQLATAQAQHRGYLTTHQQLHIQAPFSGVIAQLSEGLTPGRWLQKTQSLAYLHQPNDTHLRAYVDEYHLQHIHVGTQGRFFPDDAALTIIPVEVVEVDTSAIAKLEWPYLASIYDGPLAIRQDAQQQLIPEKALYRLHLQQTGDSPNHPETILLGSLSLPGKKESIAANLWKTVMAVLVRESGF